MKKKIGLLLILSFVILCVLLMLLEPFDFLTVCLVLYNCLAIFCILIWASFISIAPRRHKAISAFTKYWILWSAYFMSIEALLT